MGGGLMQLVAYGAQDIYLTGNPQITFFKVVYRRHTNFSIETINQTFSSTADFGRKTNVTIARNGDLVSNMCLEIKLPKLQMAQSTTGSNSTYVSWTNGIGNALVKSVAVEIGGQEIDKHYGEWLDIWSELNLPSDKKANYDKMVGNIYPSDDFDPELAKDYSNGSELTLYVPLRFWFNRNPGLALPLIALQYHEVKINIEFEETKFLVRNDNGHINAPKNSDGEDVIMNSCELLVDYIYLDTDERRRFAQVSHEYLIEQMQYLGSETLTSGSTNASVNLNFNHPVKNLNWVIQDSTFLAVDSEAGNADNKAFDSGNQKLRYSALGRINNKTDTFKNAKVQLNGHDRMTEKDADYFRVVQAHNHLAGSTNKNIYTYSFALKPGEHQPSGTCNFSRIDNAKLVLNFDSTTSSSNTNDSGSAYTSGHVNNDVEIKVYAVNYNVLRVMSGMGGLAYSN
jgi:hypothetical protein